MELLIGKMFRPGVYVGLAILVSAQGCSENLGEESYLLQEDYADSTTAQIRHFLGHAKYDELNQRLEELQAAVERDVTAEKELFEAYDAFGLMGASALSRLDDWVDEMPDHQPPYLARASYYYYLGWKQRGSAWSSETDQDNFKKMTVSFLKARNDLDRALEVNPKNMVAYVRGIDIAKASSDKAGVEKQFRRAEEEEPKSYRTRLSYIGSLEPRWGGSYKKMKAFADASQVYAQENPLIQHLYSSILLDVGRSLLHTRMYKRAIEIFSEGIRVGDIWALRQARGTAYYYRGDYEMALRDLDRAIAERPEYPKLYTLRVKVYIKLEDLESAASNLKRALLISPFDKDALEYTDYVVNRLGREGSMLADKEQFSEALAKYQHGLALKPNYALMHDKIARAHVGRGDLRKALPYADRAIELDPGDIRHVLLVDYILEKDNKWDEIIGYWDNFIESNPKISRAYVERGGAYFRKGDVKTALRDAKRAAELGNLEGKQAYERFRHMIN